MKRSSIVLLSAILFTGVASSAYAETKIGVVDIQRLAGDSPQAKDANDALRAEFGPRQKGIETQQATLKAKEDKLTKDAATMTEVQRTQADKELRDGYRDLQLKQSAFQEDLTAARQDAQDKISRLLRDEVVAFAKAQGFDLILTDAAFATGALDVTPQLLAVMQARKPGYCGSSCGSHAAREQSACIDRAVTVAPPATSMPAGATSMTLGEIAVQFGCTVHGDPTRRIASVAGLGGGPESIGFLANPALVAELRDTRLGAVVVAPAHADFCPTNALLHANPHAAFARIAAALHPQPPVQPGIHVSAAVHPDAQIAASAEVGPFAVIAAHAVVGARCRIGAHATLGECAVLGADTRLAERATVLAGCRIGARCIVHPGAVIGSDGFGNARDGVEWVKVPQLGSVRIGDDVEIGANTTIDRGALGDTVIGDGARLDNQIQVGHNVSIGAHTAIAACVGIAGSTHIGRRCMIGGGAAFSGQLTIGDDIVIAGFGQVTHSIAKPGMYSNVLPVEEARLWRRILGRIKRIEQLVTRVNRLEVAAKAAAPTGQEDDDKH